MVTMAVKRPPICTRPGMAGSPVNVMRAVSIVAHGMGSTHRPDVREGVVGGDPRFGYDSGIGRASVRHPSVSLVTGQARQSLLGIMGAMGYATPNAAWIHKLPRTVVADRVAELCRLANKQASDLLASLILD